MIFDPGREHFIGYQKVTEAPANPSTPEQMSAYVTAKSTARRPQRGDVVWLLARVGDDTPARCRFPYAFVVDRIVEEPDGKTRFIGNRGLWMPDSPLASEQPWFRDFFRGQMANGSTSIRAIEQEMVRRLQDLYGDRVAGSDVLETLEREAEAKGWPQDGVAFRAIKARRGQTEFRRRLVDAYEGRCCISGCRIDALLEAAHIRPHAVEPNYAPSNGLLLRADLHTLFDQHLLAIDEYSRVHLSPQVSDAYYKGLVDKVGRASQPFRGEARPNGDALRERMALFRRGS